MDFLFNSAAQLQQNSTIEIFLNILLAFLLGMLIAGVYALTNRNQATNRSFLLTMVILPMVTALVMMVIGNSIARAFSLVGALSIIRFRTVVKDNRDIAFIFFSLAAGMAAGIGNYPVALYGSGLILVLLMILDFISFGASSKNVYLLRIQGVAFDMDETVLDSILDKSLAMKHPLTIKTVRMGQYIEHSYFVRLKKGVSKQDFLNSLSALEGIERVNLLAEDNETEGI